MQERNVLILGAGKVAGPLVHYLLKNTHFGVIVADCVAAKAEALVGGHPAGRALSLNVENRNELEAMIRNAEIVVSMLPYVHHITVAELCLKNKKHLVTASYVKPEMQAMDREAKEAGLIFLNEIGVDPGIDHMSAMKIINQIHAQNGRVTGFKSLCGGIPAPSSNDNPWGYKFSWSPKGVAMAGLNSAQFLKNGKIVDIPSEKLFKTVFPIEIATVGKLEFYPNRDSLSYIKVYNIPEVQDMFRGTIRYQGWSRTMQAVKKLGYLKDAPINTEGLTYRDFTALLIGETCEQLEEKTAKFLGLNTKDEIIGRFAWLGLFGDTKIPRRQISPMDLLVALMEEKMYYQEGEMDLIVMIHQFEALYSDQRKEIITSKLISYGIPGGDTAMAITVGTPPAIAVKLILQGKINARGVVIPTIPEIYEPVMAEMEKQGIVFEEKIETQSLVTI